MPTLVDYKAGLSHYASNASIFADVPNVLAVLALVLRQD